jgi:uncharacterized phage protein (TIGR02218 family)
VRTVSGGLLALLNSGASEFVKADLYTITLAGGTVLRYTDADSDLTVSGNTYSSSGPILTRTQVKSTVGLDVAQLQVTLSADSSKQVNSVPWLQAIRNGVLDGATVRLDRFISDSWANTSNGAIPNWFTGRVADIKVGKSSALITVKSDLVALNVQMPRNLYQSGCIHTLYDSGCAIAKTSFKVSSAVNSSSTKTQILATLAQAAGYFDLGTISFTSGANNGAVRSIKTYTVGVINLNFPLLATPAPGDTFDIYPGCDKTQATCTNKFSNLVNFKGFPYIPTPETLL